MIKCKCGYENTDGSLFCSACGQKLEKECHECGQKLPASSKFCSNCGANLSGKQEAKTTVEGHNMIAGDVTGSYNTSYNTSVVNNVYNQVIEQDVHCSICNKQIAGAAKSTFLCKTCGKFFCESHMNLKTSTCFACSAQKDIDEFDRYKAELKMQMYDDAQKYFDAATKSTTANPDTYYYAAIALFRGQHAFGQHINTIERAEKYLNTAIRFKPKGIYYYFLAYIKYDYYERKYYRTSPNYKEALALAYRYGFTTAEQNEMYELLRTYKPACL